MTDYEKEHLRFLKQQEQTLDQLYKATIERIYRMVALTPFSPLSEGAAFSLSQYPLLEAHINQELLVLARQIDVVLVNGIKGGFERSSTKFGDLIQETYFKRGQMPDTVKQIVYSPQENALRSFQERTYKGLNLSERVFKYGVNQFKSEIEQNLFAGISEGKSASQMATLQKQHLVQPDKLFRRVRDANGKLQLSKAAKEYRPGQGVYRSSYKNALRLTVNETNVAYRTADHLRWSKTPFVISIKVELSPSHPTNKEPVRCDLLCGLFPSWYKFTGFHISCLCLAYPLMPDMAEFQEYQEYLLRGEGDKFKFKNVVTEMPPDVLEYVKGNSEVFQKWKNLPQFITDNPKVFA